MRPPCVPDCGGRSPTCHTECAKYKDFVAKRDQTYARRIRAMEVAGAVRDAADRMKKHK